MLNKDVTKRLYRKPLLGKLIIYTYVYKIIYT